MAARQPAVPRQVGVFTLKRTNCGACGYDDLHTFLDLGLSPIADAYVESRDTVSPTYPLQLAVCTGCRLVQLLEVVDQQTLFGTGYSFYSSASPPLSLYHQRYACDVLRTHGDLVKRGVVEIGCNDGDMLRWFAAPDVPHVGIDPAAGPAAKARERGLNIRNVAFTAEVGRELHAAFGPMGVVIANHVLAHVESVSSVMEGISIILAGDGVAFVEVQYLPDLLVNNAFDLVYHEHRNFFTLTSLEKAAARWGLHISDAVLTSRQGGSLRVTLTRAHAASSRVEHIRASESWLNHACAYDGFQGRVERVRTRLADILADQIADGKQVAGYGAPAKATTLLNFCGISDEIVHYVVDTTEAKQHRYIPGTGIRIRPPSPSAFTGVDTFLILAWNYASEIIRGNIHHSDRGGSWIMPIPVPTVI